MVSLDSIKNICKNSDCTTILNMLLILGIFAIPLIFFFKKTNAFYESLFIGIFTGILCSIIIYIAVDLRLNKESEKIKNDRKNVALSFFKGHIQKYMLFWSSLEQLVLKSGNLECVTYIQLFDSNFFENLSKITVDTPSEKKIPLCEYISQNTYEFKNHVIDLINYHHYDLLTESKLLGKITDSLILGYLINLPNNPLHPDSYLFNGTLGNDQIMDLIKKHLNDLGDLINLTEKITQKKITITTKK